MEFNYNNAFSRNLGFISEKEQLEISKKRIAIPGMGGVGGHHLHTLLRYGFQNFNIADLDHFEEHNFNRQIGAKVSSLGQEKVKVMHDIALDINPNADINMFPNGVNATNYEEFLGGVDYLVDGLDIYVIRERIELFELAHKKGITVITAAPLGLGTSLLCFSPEGMSFSEYFDINKDMSDKELLIRMIAGLNPKPFVLKYLRYKEYIDIANGKSPSLHGGVLAATTAIGSLVLKLVINQGSIRYVPKSVQYDFYLNKMKKNWIPFGNKNPWQKIVIKAIAKTID